MTNDISTNMQAYGSKILSEKYTRQECEKRSLEHLNVDILKFVHHIKDVCFKHEDRAFTKIDLLRLTKKFDELCQRNDAISILQDEDGSKKIGNRIAFIPFAKKIDETQRTFISFCVVSMYCSLSEVTIEREIRPILFEPHVMSRLMERKKGAEKTAMKSMVASYLKYAFLINSNWELIKKKNMRHYNDKDVVMGIPLMIPCGDGLLFGHVDRIGEEQSKKQVYETFVISKTIFGMCQDSNERRHAQHIHFKTYVGPDELREDQIEFINKIEDLRKKYETINKEHIKGYSRSLRDLTLTFARERMFDKHFIDAGKTMSILTEDSLPRTTHKHYKRLFKSDEDTSEFIKEHLSSRPKM